MALEYIGILSKAVPPALPGIGSRPRSATGGSTSGYAMNGMDGNESASITHFRCTYYLLSSRSYYLCSISATLFIAFLLLAMHFTSFSHIMYYLFAPCNAIA
jgi:hypothetical protein